MSYRDIEQWANQRPAGDARDLATALRKLADHIEGGQGNAVRECDDFAAFAAAFMTRLRLLTEKAL